MKHTPLSEAKKRESQEMLARLLARENLKIVYSASARTATFQVLSRTVTLPTYSFACDDVFLLFSAHEVAHAIWTLIDPLEAYKIICPSHPQRAVPFFQICEDVRIERLVKQQYPGLRAVFGNGYAWLLTKIVKIPDDLNTLTFIDRVNMYYKFGHLVSIPFANSREITLRDMAAQTITIQDTLDVAKLMMEYQKEEPNPFDVPEEPEPDDSESEDSNGDAGGDSEEGEESGDSEDDLDSSEYDAAAPFFEEMQQAIEDKIARESQKPNEFNPDSYDVPPIYTSKILKPIAKFEPLAPYDLLVLRKELMPDVSFMCSQFQLKRKALDDARTALHQTGEIDENMLHSYRSRTDIFANEEIVSDQQNHGFMIILDFSVSMNTYFRFVFKEIFLMLEFCRRMEIPFRVFVFQPSQCDTFGGMSAELSRIGLRQTNMCELFSSTMSSKDIDERFIYLFSRLQEEPGGGCSRFHGSTGYENTPGLIVMRNTPLNESFLLTGELFNRWKNDSNIDKLHTIVFTDDGANGLKAPRILYDPQTHMVYRGKDNDDNIFKQVYRDRTRSSMTAFVVTHKPEQYSTETQDFDKKGYMLLRDVRGYDRMICFNAVQIGAVGNDKLRQQPIRFLIDSVC